jgi:kynurenine formamidase
MNIIDLSHAISSRMPVYPGTDPPSITTGCSIEEDGFLEKKIIMFSHTGTHMDAPAHMIKDSKALDQFSIDHFYGKALLVDVSTSKKPMIEINDLIPVGSILKEHEFMLIRTGWSHHWGADSYFIGYPVLTIEAVEWLSQFNLKGFGVDAISVDGSASEDFPVHRILLKNDIVIIENLKNLDRIPVHSFTFACFPLKYAGADGAPVRAVALY